MSGRVAPMTLVTLLLVLSLRTPAIGWGNEGHQAIGEAAQTRLSPKAEAALAKILIGGQGTTLPPGKLAAIATWPDEIRARKAFGTIGSGWDAADITEADDFNKAHKNNANWHFVNLALGVPSYGDTASAPFTADDDIVRAINDAISILESDNPPSDFSKGQAVRWIVHLVGDIHQPMHVTTGYYRTTAADLKNPKIISDPGKASGASILGDRGGNGLLFSTEANNLHAVWDVCLVQLVASKACTSADNTYSVLARRIVTLMKQSSSAKYNPSGDHHGWAAAWATDSLKQAVDSRAYDVTLTHGHIHTSHSGEEFLQAKISSPTKAAYADAHSSTAREQLLKAAIRLADLFNAIWE